MAGKTDDNIESLDILTYDGVRMKVGATTSDELESIIREGGRRGEIYGKLKTIAATYGDLVRAALSQHSPARLRLQPELSVTRKRLSRGARFGRAPKEPA